MGTYEAGVSADEPVWNLYMVCIKGQIRSKRLRNSSGANVATWAIPFLYYTYMGVLGFSKMWLDIATFFVAVLTGFAVEYHVLRRAGHESFVLGTWIMAIVDFMMAAAFVSCSYGAPELGIFAKP